MAIKVAKGVEVDAAAFLAHLHDFSLVMGKSMGEVIREQAGLFCKDMVKYTRPFTSPSQGATGASKKVGIKNVNDSLYTIFRPINRATKEQVASLGSPAVFKLWNRRHGTESTKKMRWEPFQARYGNGKKAEFIGAGDVGKMKSMHTSLRLDNGRGGLKPSARKSKEPFAIVEKESDLKRYIREKQKQVGFLKSAYSFAANRIGAKETFPAWAQIAGASVNAIASDQTSVPKMPSITVGNLIGNKLNNQSNLRLALNHRAFAMRVRMAAELKKQGKTLWEATMSGQIGGSRSGFTQS